MRIPRLLTAAVSVLLLVILYQTSVRYLRSLEHERRLREVYLEKEAQWHELSLKLRSEIDKFRGKVGIVIKDLEYGFEFFHNEVDLFASASLSKVPIMAAIHKAEYEGIVGLDLEMTLNRSDILPGSGNLRFMAPGTIFSLRELLDLMMSVSDNTATNMVTSAIGMDYINHSIMEFGMKNSLLARRVADYDARERGLENYTTALDMASILESIYNGELVNEEVSAKSLELLFDQKSRDRIPGKLPGDIRVAHKTGLERGVCHDAGIVFDPQGNFIIVVLTGHSNPNSIPSKNFISSVALMAYQRHGSEEEKDDAVSPAVRVTLSAREIQTFLAKEGLYAGRIDGIIGPVTRRAVREFQVLSDLTPDGVVGPETTRAMLEYSASMEKDMFR